MHKIQSNRNITFTLVSFRQKKPVFGIFQDNGEKTQQKSNKADKP